MTPIDAHHHLWQRHAPAAGKLPQLDRDFTMDDFRHDAAPTGVHHSVVVQTVGDIAESRELLALAARDDSLVGVVGWVDLTAPDREEQLDRLGAQPGGSTLVGIRQRIPGAAASPVASAAFVGGLRALAGRGLAFDLLITPDELDAAGEIAAQVPELRFVVDHLAKPCVNAEGFARWAPAFARLAAQPNVAVKFSGLLTQLDAERQSADDLEPYLTHAFRSFGTHRILFGSDWPICTLAGGYPRVMESASQLLSGLSDDEERRIMGENALAWYGLSVPAIGAEQAS